MGNGTERIERRVKLHDLRVLMSVVERGSMAKAAESLATSQPAVSRAIADLENSLGVRLLDRGPRGILPTPYGHALFKRAVTVFDELKMSVQDLEFLADPTAGEVWIGAPTPYAAGFVTAVIDGLARRHPRVVCHLIVSNDVANLRALEQREVDLVITPVPVPITADHLHVEPLYADPLFVVAAKTNPWSRRRSMRLADLMNEPWTLAPPGSPGGAVVADIFRAAGLDRPAATAVSTSGVARIALVAKGRFLTIAVESQFRYADRDMAIKVLPVDLRASPIPVVILTLNNRTLTPVAQLFIDCAREVAKRWRRANPSRHDAGKLERP
jgi:DNA-binding transcriptional LysR family regulator